ncbi:MAG: acetate--CoA ligase family protein [Pseudomonadota bacterium]
MDLERLFRPKTIAAIGGLQASRVIEQCQLLGYEGEIWPVHPSKDEVQGLRAYRSVEELPGSPDAAYIAVNRKLTIDIVKSLRAKDCGGAICYASGFLEADDTGAQLQSDLIEAAADMPVVGPNCYGLINYADGALLWPDLQGGKRLEAGKKGVAIIAQSSNIAINFTMQQRALPLAYVITVGNQAIVGISDLAHNVLDDPRVTTLGIYVEGFDSVSAMESLAHKARKMGKAVVIFKVGKSEQSQIAAVSHTASLVGSHEVTSEFLRRYGFGQANSIPVFLESLKMLHVYGPLPGYQISSMSCSGGEASIIADSVEPRKVYFPDLNDEQKAPIQDALGPLVTVANPLDYHTYSWANREMMQGAYEGMTRIGLDMNFLIIDFPRRDRCDDWEWDIAVEAFEAALEKHQARGAFVVGMPENIAEDYAEKLLDRGLLTLYGIDEALQAAEIAADIGRVWEKGFPKPVMQLASLSGTPNTLAEHQAKQALQACGVPIPAGKLITSLEAAIAAASEIGYPVVLKAMGIAHKTEQNAVRLNLESEAAVSAAAQELFELSDQLYLEAMVESSLAELIVGVTRDQQFGLVLTLGSGGILVELLKDSQTLLMPATREEVESALLKLKSAPLLQGYRGKPKADIKACVDAIMAIQAYAVANAETLSELDVNPLLVGPHGATAADALILLEE